MTMAVNIDKDACIGCGACVGGCPVGALSLDDEGKSTSNSIKECLPSLMLGNFFWKERSI